MAAGAAVSGGIVAALVDACGDARAAEDGEAIAGVPARYVAAPSSTADCAAVLAVAVKQYLRVVVRGAGTKQGWGAPPEAVDLLLDLSKLTGVVEHAAGDLVVVARAGTPMAELQATVAPAKQRLALDPMVSGGEAAGTVGGTVATGVAGPLRLQYGGPRDLLIGATVVRADGVVARSGGKVVKNVAGYDVGKLVAGSYGTLAILTVAAFRLHPLPPAQAWVSVPVGTPAEAGELTARVVASQLVPAAVELDWPATNRGPAGSDGREGELAVLLEGGAGGVPARAEAAAALLGAAATVTDTSPAWWGRCPFDQDEIGLQLTTPIAGLAPALSALRGAAGGDLSVRGSAGTGLVYAGLPRTTEPVRVAAAVEAARAVLAGTGSCVLLQAPAEVRAVVDAWGPVPGLELMRRVKHRFDPDRRLAPGRFVGGI